MSGLSGMLGCPRSYEVATEAEKGTVKMAKTTVPASPGYFILAACKDDDGSYRIDNRTPVIAWHIDAAHVALDEREDAEAIGITKFSDNCPQVVIGLDDKICLCLWDSSFEGKTVEEWLKALAAKAAANKECGGDDVVDR